MNSFFGRYTYRRFAASDLPEVLALWSHDSGWGAITPQDWDQWFTDTPYGNAVITVAENEQGEVVGQGTYLPTRVYAGGREVKGLRMSAPILSKKLRLLLPGTDHPVIGLLRKAIEIARDEETSVLHAMPKRQFLAFQRWTSMLNLPRFVTAEFPCVEQELSALHSSNCLIPTGWQANRITQFGPEYDELWERAKTNMPINGGLVRRSKYLQYRLGGHLVIEARDQLNDVVGYVAIRKESGLIDDMLACSLKDLPNVIRSAISVLKEVAELPKEFGIQKIKAMETPYLQPVFQELAFERVKFRFGYACCSLDKNLSLDTLEPNNWYVMPGD